MLRQEERRIQLVLVALALLPLVVVVLLSAAPGAAGVAAPPLHWIKQKPCTGVPPTVLA